MNNQSNYNEYRELINGELANILKSWQPELGSTVLAEAISYVVLADAKRLRPVLALLIIDSCGIDFRKYVKVACSVEVLHLASLILDDLPSMDDAKLRKGKQTLHLAYSESTAILASAGIWTKTFELLCSGSDMTIDGKLVKLTCQYVTERGLLAGQYDDLNNFSRLVTRADLIDNYSKKTASMFRLSAQIGCTLAKLDKITAQKLDVYALNLGLAFQIIDDILDQTESEVKLGKDAKIDSKNHKLNIVDVVGISSARSMAAEYLAKAEQCLGELKQIDTTKLEGLLKTVSNLNQ